MSGKFKLIDSEKLLYQEQFIRFQAFQDKNDYNKKVQELAMSIKELGLMNPITVTPEGDNFRVKAGNRRLQACKDVLQWKEIPCMIFEKDNIMLTIAENLQREDLTDIEKGEWINKALELGKSKGEKAEETMKSISLQTGKAPRTLYEMAQTARKASPEDKAAVKAGKKNTTDVKKSIREKGAKKINKGQEVKRNGKAFLVLSKKLVEKLKYIASNAPEYKQDKNLSVEFKRLVKAVELTNVKLTEVK